MSNGPSTPVINVARITDTIEDLSVLSSVEKQVIAFNLLRQTMDESSEHLLTGNFATAQGRVFVAIAAHDSAPWLQAAMEHLTRGEPLTLHRDLRFGKASAPSIIERIKNTLFFWR